MKTDSFIENSISENYMFFISLVGTHVGWLHDWACSYHRAGQAVMTPTCHVAINDE